MFYKPDCIEGEVILFLNPIRREFVLPHKTTTHINCPLVVSSNQINRDSVQLNQSLSVLLLTQLLLKSNITLSNSTHLNRLPANNAKGKSTLVEILVVFGTHRHHLQQINEFHDSELEWEICIPTEVAQNVYMHLMERGKEYGVTHAESVVEKLLIFLCFYLAAICNLLFFNSRIKVLCFETVAIEKFFVCWGQDISTNVTLLECGRTYRVDFNKDFIGKDALLGQKLNGIHKRFVQLFVDNYDLDHDPWPQGGDLIYRYGEPVGRTTQLVMDILLIVR